MKFLSAIHKDTVASWFFLATILVCFVLPRTKQYGVGLFTIGLMLYMLEHRKNNSYIALLPYISVPLLAILLPLKLPPTWPGLVRLTVMIACWNLLFVVFREIVSAIYKFKKPASSHSLNSYEPDL